MEIIINVIACIVVYCIYIVCLILFKKYTDTSHHTDEYYEEIKDGKTNSKINLLPSIYEKCND